MGAARVTPFATAGFSYDANISPNNQSFSGAVLAVALRNGTQIVAAGGGISNGGTATLSRLSVGTATISDLIAPVTITGGAGTTLLTLVGTGSGTVVGTGLLITINGTTVFQITGGTSTTGAPTALVVQGYGPAAGGLVDMTSDTGTFTGTLTGLTTAAHTICTFYRIGKLVTIFLGVGNGTSNATTLTMTGLPAELQPATLTSAMGGVSLENNGASVLGSVEVSPGSGTISFYNGAFSAAWTSSGFKGMNNGVISYLLN